jgi:caffeoyl-CoA O-methyltransferase
VFRLAVPRLRRGGLFVSDNALWHGQVAPAALRHAKADERTKAVLEFNRLLYNSPELFAILLPLRDGVAVAVKQ